MISETTRARRKCGDCRAIMEKGEAVWVAYHTNPYGTEKVSYCKVCTIKGLHIRKRNIEALLKQIGEV